MKRYAAIVFAVVLTVAAAGCGTATENGVMQTAIPTATLAEEPSRIVEHPSAQINSVRFLEAFSIGHPSEAENGIEVFVINSEQEEAKLLEGLDAVAEEIAADYQVETVILITFTANCITYEEEYSLRSVELAAGGGRIEILYTSTPDRSYAEAICPYYAIIAVPKTSLSSEKIEVEIENAE